MIKTKERLFVCQICDASFYSLRYLNQHITRMKNHNISKEQYWLKYPDLLKEYLKIEVGTRYIINKDTECWEWIQGKISKNYGKYDDNLAHRLLYELYKGSIPDGMLVCHHCDNPCCVNPEHLFIGTYKDNAVDMIKKGRGRMSNVEECIKHGNTLRGRKRPDQSIFTKQNPPMHNAETVKKVSDKLSGRTKFEYLCTSPIGESFRVFNLKKFCDKYSLNYDCMQYVANGKIKQHKNGWLCNRLLKERNRWKENTNQLIFVSLKKLNIFN